jgi:hypothetical protein
MRLHQGRGKQDFRRGRRLGQNDRIVVWQKPAQRPPRCSKEEYDQLAKTLTLRILRFKITVPGFRSKEVILATTLLDPKRYPALQLGKKVRQGGSQDNLAGGAAEGVRSGVDQGSGGRIKRGRVYTKDKRKPVFCPATKRWTHSAR